MDKLTSGSAKRPNRPGPVAVSTWAADMVTTGEAEAVTAGRPPRKRLGRNSIPSPPQSSSLSSVLVARQLLDHSAEATEQVAEQLRQPDEDLTEVHDDLPSEDSGDGHVISLRTPQSFIATASYRRLRLSASRDHMVMRSAMPWPDTRGKGAERMAPNGHSPAPVSRRPPVCQCRGPT